WWISGWNDMPPRPTAWCWISTTPAMLSTAISSYRSSTPTMTSAAFSPSMSTTRRRADRWQSCCGRARRLRAVRCGRIRRRWPTTHLTIRGHSHYARPEAMDFCEANGLSYIFGLTGTRPLTAKVQDVADAGRTRRAIGDREVVRDFAET